MHKLQFLLIIFLLYGCIQPDQGKGKDIFKQNSNNGIIDVEPDILTFNGLTNGDGVTDNKVNLYWEHVDGINTYTIIDQLNSNQVMAVVSAPTSQYQLSGLAINTHYRLYVLPSSDKQVNVSYPMFDFTTSDTPAQPFQIERLSPQVNIGQIDQPIYRIHGTKSGDTVYLYSDAGCTTLVGSSLAPSGNYTDIQSSSLPLGNYEFHAVVENQINNSSDCSDVSSSYTVSECPFNYVKFAANPALGTNQDFCVAKFEMRCSTDPNGTNCQAGAAQSTHEGLPWVNISQADAIIKCSDLGANYSLINNAQWMTMAREIENKNLNWSNATIGGNEKMNTGHAFNSPAVLMPASENIDEACLYMSETCDDATWNQKKRTHKNANLDIIWDLTGNAWEWIADPVIHANKPAELDQWIDITDIQPTANFPASMFLSSTDSYSALINYTGVGYISSNTNYTIMKRGGNFNQGVGAGIYSFTVNNENTNTSSSIGFRCVYTIP